MKYKKLSNVQDAIWAATEGGWDKKCRVCKNRFFTLDGREKMCSAECRMRLFSYYRHKKRIDRAHVIFLRRIKETQVMNKLYDEGKTCVEIGKKFGVHHTTVLFRLGHLRIKPKLIFFNPFRGQQNELNGKRST